MIRPEKKPVNPRILVSAGDKLGYQMPMRSLISILLLALTFNFPTQAVPVIYSTDLFHPHNDPDDHFDLATLFALPELEVKAILLDQGGEQLKHPGSLPLAQMRRITGQKVPSAIGLAEKLSSSTDDGRAQPAQFQAAIELLLKTLRESQKPVTIITAGSVRDVCAAWNRDPNLFRQKVGRLYLNIGSADDGTSEFNVQLDPLAYAGLMRSGLPIYWCPCLPIPNVGSNTIYRTYWHFHQSDVLETAPRSLQNFFIYALQRPAANELDPLKALKADPRPWRRLVWEMDRNMWCTAPFLHAAGYQLRLSGQRWTLSRPAEAVDEAANPFTFIPAHVEVDDQGNTRKSLNSASPNMQIFKVSRPDAYQAAMRDSLRQLYQRFPQ